MNKEELSKYFEENKERILSEYFEYLRFKSISADSKYHDECLNCAKWLIAHLEGLGCKAELWETEGKPVVFAEYIESSDLPTVLVYGHYDVQPAAKEDGWDTEPFEPVLNDNNVIARGAGDNKGQLLYVIKAMQCLIETSQLKCNVRFVIEGEEEVGSYSLIDNVTKWQDRLKSDLLFVTDSTMLAPNVPAIDVAMRGVLHLNLRLDGPNFDLHSGLFGGASKNTAQELVRMLSKLHNKDGSIAVPGFYDDIEDVSAEEREAISKIPFDSDEFTNSLGIEPTGGEQKYTPRERLGLRPTIEINGVCSGYNGEGGKTIIPAYATANISGRTVRGQDGKRALELIKDYLQELAPKEMKLSFNYDGCESESLSADLNSPVLKFAKEIYAELYETEAVLNWHGATIPVLPELYNKCSEEVFCTGFGLGSDGWHGNNELFGLDRFEKGFILSGLVLSRYEAK